TGECNAYGECRGPQIVGILAVAGTHRTRIESWQVIRIKSADGSAIRSAFPELAPNAAVSTQNIEGFKAARIGSRNLNGVAPIAKRFMSSAALDHLFKPP